jgi:hypothetical protein
VKIETVAHSDEDNEIIRKLDALVPTAALSSSKQFSTLGMTAESPFAVLHSNCAKR